MIATKVKIPFGLHSTIGLLIVIFLTASTVPSAALDIGTDVPIRGVVRAVNKATLAAGVRAPVASIRYREGEQFKKGDVLLEFDCAPQKAELRSAKAAREGKAVNLNSAKYLLGLKAGSSQDVQIAKSQLEQADAEIDALAARLAQCSMIAPFDGAVYEQHIRQFELPTEGAPVLSIVDMHRLEIELIVPSAWLRDVEPGRRFKFEIDETGASHVAIIRRVAPIIDPVSQTMKVYAGFVKMDAVVPIVPGMSGNATFDQDWAIR